MISHCGFDLHLMISDVHPVAAVSPLVSDARSWGVQLKGSRVLGTGVCLLMGRSKPWGLWLQSPRCPGAGAFPLLGEVGLRLSAQPLVCGGFPSGSAVKNPPAMQETQV